MPPKRYNNTPEALFWASSGINLSWLTPEGECCVVYLALSSLLKNSSFLWECPYLDTAKRVHDFSFLYSGLSEGGKKIRFQKRRVFIHIHPSNREYSNIDELVKSPI
jgi:hypothetical protein